MPARRSQYIVTFNSSPHYRVLIMETRIASHGLNVTSASRVYFLSTPWQRSVEKQAIKRAHRIGQTREVFVEKLVLGGTIEEVVVRRREEMGLRELEGKKGFLEDGKVRGIIESARFVSPIGRREEMVDEGDETGEGERGRGKGMVFDGVSGCDGFGEFGRLFNVKEKDDEVDRVLEIIEESEKREKRKAPVAGSTVPKERKNPPGEKSSDRKRKLRFDENEDSEGISKRSMIIRLRIPKVSKDNTRRRVQFVES
jgi:Helicase conserved C-terminal domain